MIERREVGAPPVEAAGAHTHATASKHTLHGLLTGSLHDLFIMEIHLWSVCCVKGVLGRVLKVDWNKRQTIWNMEKIAKQTKTATRGKLNYVTCLYAA